MKIQTFPHFLLIVSALGTQACATRPLSLGSLPLKDECLAVLPFEVRYDLSSSRETISELLALELYRMGAHGVIGPMESSKIFQQVKDPLPAAIDPYWARTLGRRLGVDAVVFGSVARLPVLRDKQGRDVQLHVNIDAYLMDVNSGEIRWTFGVKEVMADDAFVTELSSYAAEMSQSLLAGRANAIPFGNANCWKQIGGTNAASKSETKSENKPKEEVAITKTTTAPPLPDAVSQMEKRVSRDLKTSNGLRLDSAAFEGRGDRLTPLAAPKLDALAQVMGRPDGPEFLEISGHVDATANGPEDLDSSRWRAEAVKKYLENRGVDPARLKAIGYGGTRPVAPNINVRSRSRNRRIEIRMPKSAKP